MRFEGGCYCKKIRYVAEGTPLRRGQCLCRECQYISGGGPNFFFVMPLDGFSYVSGEPKSFTRDDIENPATRDFCPNCGTHLATRRAGMPIAIVKVGTMDDPSLYGQPEVAIFACDKQDFHTIAAGLPTFDKRPPAR